MITGPSSSTVPCIPGVGPNRRVREQVVRQRAGLSQYCCLCMQTHHHDSDSRAFSLLYVPTDLSFPMVLSLFHRGFGLCSARCALTEHTTRPTNKCVGSGRGGALPVIRTRNCSFSVGETFGGGDFARPSASSSAMPGFKSVGC
jgi:hypothetical protein